jgi:hypothetical protein
MKPIVACFTFRETQHIGIYRSIDRAESEIQKLFDNGDGDIPHDIVYSKFVNDVPEQDVYWVVYVSGQGSTPDRTRMEYTFFTTAACATGLLVRTRDNVEKCGMLDLPLE